MLSVRLHISNLFCFSSSVPLASLQADDATFASALIQEQVDAKIALHKFAHSDTSVWGHADSETPRQGCESRDKCKVTEKNRPLEDFLDMSNRPTKGQEAIPMTKFGV
ncbi:unnamed protein product [Protopolystoma xenopodis]|uniref:Uncharacterized protein n=1 Tax=Protopolystoma xenopodis TaxID=117903 RepID=A0A448XIE2_9PLAT|nr:unnamed protein product [Protopolystoma xenopodis]